MNAIQNLQEFLGQDEAIYIENEISRLYLSGFASSDGVLLIVKESAHLFLDSRYCEMGIIAQKGGQIPANVTLEKDAFSDAAFTRYGIKRVYYEDLRLTCARLAELKERHAAQSFAPLGDRIERLRAVKTPAELAKIRAAQALTEEAFDYIMPLFSPRATELSLAAEIDCFFRRRGAESAFETILVSGAHSALPHGRPEDVPLSKNSFCTLDFGAKLDGYCADMTRTVVIGKADEEMRALYELVRAAQEAALTAIHGGVSGKAVDAAARDMIVAAGYGDCFGHGTGHALGLEVHEKPTFSMRCEEPIPAGAVLSVEPGVYLAGKYGVRIEDIVAVTQDGCENLTHAKKELICLD